MPYPWAERLRPYQVEAGHAILDSVVYNKGLSFSIEMARQAGKNELSARIQAYLLSRYRGDALDSVKCAPTFEPQARLSLRRLWSRLQELEMCPPAVIEAGHIVRFGKARQFFLSAAPEANVAGHSAGRLLEVDEAQDVDPEKFDRDFRPMASVTNATVVYYGTAWDSTTLLERAKQHHILLERRDGIRRHFEYDWRVAAKHNPAYGRYVEAERDRLGEQHPLLLTQYCLQAVRSGNRLFGASALAQLQGHHSRQIAPAPNDTYVAGLDIAGGPVGEDEFARRHDSTVLTIARAVFPETGVFVYEPRLDVVQHYVWTGVPHDKLIPRLAQLLREVWRVRRLAVDATGLGETIARLLTLALGSHVVLPLKFTAETKSRLGFGLLAAVNGGRLKLYAQDGSLEYQHCLQELEHARAEFRLNRTMNFLVDAPEGHDDYLISLALLVDAGTDAAPRVARGRVIGL